MTYPFPFPVTYTLTVTRCAANAAGNTDVEASFLGVPLKPFELIGVEVGPAPGQAGFDDVRSRIESCVIEQIQDALRAAG